MEHNQGVTPTGPGSRASHEAASASSPKASIPNAVSVVVRSIGEYSDRYETVIRAFVSEEDAKQFVERATAEWQEAESLYPEIRYPPGSWNLPRDDPAMQTYRAEAARRTAAFTARLHTDPDVGTSEPTYYYETVPLFASCDTHPEGGDVKQAPFMGSAVPEGQTPKPSGPRDPDNG